VNESPYDAGWLFRIRVDRAADLDALLDAAAYRASAPAA
jgi:glycine cleavage system H protein